MTAEYLTLTEAAALVRRSAFTLKDWAKRGRLKYVRLGRAMLIARDDLERAVRQESGHKGPAADAPEERCS